MQLFKTTFLITLYMVSHYLYADADTLKIEPKKMDSSSIDSISGPTYEDSLKFLPAYDLYKNWDNIHVHYKGHDLTKLDDTLKFNLAFDTCDYMHPFCGEVTSKFGMRRGRHHYGIDIDLVTGDKVYPAFEGTVRIAQYSSGYGKLVVVRHTNGLETYYGHLSKVLVKEGQKIETSDVIALGGNTGRSTGSHLHFEVRYLGNAINPQDLIDFDKGALLSNDFELSKKNFNYLVELRKRKYHRVRSGDCLSKIARRYGVSLSKLYRLNRMSSRSILRIGQRIRYN